jgi:cell filamentation protein, protein adenylyltransferase
MPAPGWRPRFTLSPAAVRSLLEVEAARAVVDHAPVPPGAADELRRRARLRSTHYSTRIEGNRLTLAEAEKVIEGGRVRFHGRERDVLEVRNYWHALLRVEEWAAKGQPLTEDLIRRLHGLVERGRRARPTPYRDGLNVIRDSETGALVYLPPEARDVPELMADLVLWVKRAEAEGLAVPMVAGLAHYQLVTIHPYYDGNGRTARLLATFLLHRGGYGLHGFFSLEEYHARDLAAYYRSLAAHPHHNYYEGRAEADLTPWVEYFLKVLAQVFTAAKDEALAASNRGAALEPEAIRRLDPRARVVLGLFARQDRITSREVANALGLSERMVRVLLKDWVQEGLLTIAEPSRRSRAYALSAIYRHCRRSSGSPSGRATFCAVLAPSPAGSANRSSRSGDGRRGPCQSPGCPGGGR